MVAERILYGDQQRHFYCVHAWVVMPNHVHLILEPWQEPPVILRWLKGSTAREANRILSRTGRPFWQDETFDHWVRQEGERQKIIRYIEWNPVTAGLASCIEEWPWSSAHLAGGSACPTYYR
jgi:REP element-mobilizing transposase RayT